MAICQECSHGDHANHQPSLAGICVGCECPEVVSWADVFGAEKEGPPAATVSDAGAHTGGLNGAMAHHGAAAVASIALPAEHVFAHLRAIAVRTKALEYHLGDDHSASVHVQAILNTMRELLQEIADSAFLAELAARQTKALNNVINRPAGSPGRPVRDAPQA